MRSTNFLPLFTYLTPDGKIQSNQLGSLQALPGLLGTVTAHVVRVPLLPRSLAMCRS